MSQQARDQHDVNVALTALAMPVLLMIWVYFGYAVRNFRAGGGRDRRRPADHRRRPDPGHLADRDLRDGPGARRVRHDRPAGHRRRRRRPGARPARQAGRRGERAAGPGDRAAVGVDLPLSRIRRRRDAPSSRSRSGARSSCTSPRLTSPTASGPTSWPSRRTRSPDPTTSPTSRRFAPAASRCAAPSSAACGTAT